MSYGAIPILGRAKIVQYLVFAKLLFFSPPGIGAIIRKFLENAIFWQIEIMNPRLQQLFIIALLFFCPMLLKAQKVMTTKNGNKYHLQDCRYAKSDASATDVKDALAKKYVACDVCKPPTKPDSDGKQCSAKTKDGGRCSRMTSSKNGKCWQHSN